MPILRTQLISLDISSLDLIISERKALVIVPIL